MRPKSRGLYSPPYSLRQLLCRGICSFIKQAKYLQKTSSGKAIKVLLTLIVLSVIFYIRLNDFLLIGVYLTLLVRVDLLLLVRVDLVLLIGVDLVLLVRLNDVLLVRGDLVFLFRFDLLLLVISCIDFSILLLLFHLGVL